jgi:Fe-S-cluster-containing hydrogenase component 2
MLEGPVVVIECIQEIPCNPCEEACPKEAITVGSPITNLPQLDEEKCIGCGLCLSSCPGLAIFLVDLAYSDELATVAFPYEYLPLPEVRQRVTTVDRAGKPVCEGEVVKVTDAGAADRTPIITVAISSKYAGEVRGILRPGGK